MGSARLADSPAAVYSRFVDFVWPDSEPCSRSRSGIDDGRTPAGEPTGAIAAGDDAPDSEEVGKGECLMGSSEFEPVTIHAPPEECWVDPTIELRPSPIAGHGLYASAPISEGTVVVRFGGQLLTQDAFRELLDATPEHLKRALNEDPTVTYLDAIFPYEGYVLVIPFGENEHLGRNIHFNNHSCDPNVWHTDAYTLAARRDIGADEEITVDYSTQVGSEGMRFDCNCGSEICRKVVTGSDWRRSELQKRYGTHWTPTLLERIRREHS